MDELVDSKRLGWFVADQEGNRALPPIGYMENDGIRGTEAKTRVMLAPNLKGVQILSTVPVNGEQGKNEQNEDEGNGLQERRPGCGSKSRRGNQEK
jgi:hypothetical protein